MVITEDRLVLRPVARMASILGEHLIRDNTTGVLELIKNGYDADAENVLVELGKKPEKYKVPENFDYNQARYLFKNALVISIMYISLRLSDLLYALCITPLSNPNKLSHVIFVPITSNIQSSGIINGICILMVLCDLFSISTWGLITPPDSNTEYPLQPQCLKYFYCDNNADRIKCSLPPEEVKQGYQYRSLPHNRNQLAVNPS